MSAAEEEKVLWSFGVIPPDAEVIDCSADESGEDDGSECSVVEISEKEAGRYKKSWER